MNIRVETDQEVLSWQYIVLIAAIAVLIALVAFSAIPVERAERPVPLDELTLTQHYDDTASGISLNHPAGWVATPLEGGRFMVTNYPPISAAPPEDWGRIQFQFIAAPTEGLAAETTPGSILETLLSRNQLDADITTDLAIADMPAARTHFAQPNAGIEVEWVALMPNEDTLIIIQAIVAQGYWTEASGIFDRILDTLTLAETAG